MIALTIAEIAEIIGARLDARARDAVATTLSGTVQTDSRLVEPGAIFIAMPGTVADGHDFVGQAAANGAALAVVERETDAPLPHLVVPSSLTALADLATAVVQRVRDRGELTVIGVTGSNGKTTTKNLLRAILGSVAPTVAPQGSFNNHVGAPISMLGITDETRYLIVEMGASGIGEIARTAAIAKPDIGVVLKVGLAHAGEFGGIDATRRAKSELVAALRPDGVAVLNLDDPNVAGMAELTEAAIVGFGHSPAAEVRATEIDVDAGGTSFRVEADGASHPVRLRILGEHHVMNALAALAVVRELGVPVADAIRTLESVTRAERWRMEVLQTDRGVTVINDAYNASPDSTAAALKTLAQIAAPGQRTFAVLGEMAELGEYSDEEHDRIGRLAVRLNISQLVVVGSAARHIHNAAGLEGSWDGESKLVETVDEAYDLVQQLLKPGDLVLVKSSKSAGLRFLGDRLAGVAE